MSKKNSLYVSLIVAISALLYSGLSLARYRAYNAAMLDLGNMAQAMWSVTQGKPLLFTQAPVGAVSRLAGHVEIIYFALAPLLLVWSDPQILLIAQSVLFASAAFAVYAMASRRLPATSSLCFAVGYLLYPTAITAVLFDLHGDTLAMPLLLWMLWALDAGAWRRFWLFLVLSLLCKFYIVAPVGALGLTLLFARTAPFDLASAPYRRRLGLAICAVAGIYGVVALFGIRPYFAVASASSSAYARYYFGSVLEIGVLGILDRVVNLLAVLVPSAFLWWRARWTFAPALAIIGPALISTGPGAAYAWSYHHYAAAVPFIVAGSVVGATRMAARTKNPRLRQRDAVVAGALFFGMSLIFHIGLSDTPLGVSFYRNTPGYGLTSGGYGRTRRDVLKDRWLESVPVTVPVATSNFLAPRLFQHDTLYLVRYPDEPQADRLSTILPRIEIALPDALFDFVQQSAAGYVGGVTYDIDAIRRLLQASDWGLTAARDGLLRFERSPIATTVLHQRIQRVESQQPAAARFGDGIELIQANLEPLGERRYRATFRWRATRDFAVDEFFIAVSRLEGVSDARMVHLPTYALQPTTTWRAGDTWEEQLDVEVPTDVPSGRYTWHVGWYDTRNPFAGETDAASRVGDESAVMALDLP